MQNPQYTNPMEIIDPSLFIPVDDWIPLNQNDIIFRSTKGAIILPVSKFYGVSNTALDYFDMSSKRCYNGNDTRDHITHYLNYFTKFYDKDHEMLSIYYRIKYLIDLITDYNQEAFFADINRYILHGGVAIKLQTMNIQNYNLNMSYRHNKNPGLQYTDKHASILYQISLFMVSCIPLLCHFAKVKKIEDINKFLLEAYDMILNLYPDVDIISKLYETATTTINTNVPKNQILWNAQDIRSIDPVTHALDSIDNILLNIMPKYNYNKNIVIFNYGSILKAINYQVVEIGYEFNFTPLSSSNRDEDNNSEFDRFESYQIKQDESLYVMNKVNCEQTMKTIESIYGPFDPKEVQFYVNSLTNEDGRYVIHPFQKKLVFYLFYKNFGDPTSSRAINKEDFAKLMIAGKRILQANNMVIMPYILTSKIIRINQRKSLNKKEMTKMEASPIYRSLIEKYRNDKIMEEVIQLAATILSSEFEIASYYEPELNGKKIEMFPEIIIEEVLMFTSLI